MIEYSGFYRDGDFMSTEQVDEAKDATLRICAELKPQMLRFTDLVPLPGRVTYGAIGQEDGKVYERFLKNVYAAPKAFERAEWWKSIYE